MASRLIKEDRLARNERLKRAGSHPSLSFPSELYLSRYWERLFSIGYQTKPHPPTEESRKQLHTSLTTLGSQIDADLRDRITTIHQNAQSLETQTRTLKNRTAALSKTTRQWSGMAESARSKLKVGTLFNPPPQKFTPGLVLHPLVCPVQPPDPTHTRTLA